jgi:hypothetical protein
MITSRLKERFPLAAVYAGTDFEHQTIALLSKYGFVLDHVGGTGDEGIDFTGRWDLPKVPVSVVGQCKYLSSKAISVKTVREWEGVLHRLQASHSATLGLLASSQQLSRPSRKRMDESTLPMAFAHLEKGLIKAFVMNGAAEALVPDIFAVPSVITRSMDITEARVVTSLSISLRRRT